MDARKALFRAKLREQKQEKRIESPLVRYNEYDQPVCRVCNITLKSESSWAAHQASRKHHEAIQNLKAAASGKASGHGTKADLPKDTKEPRSSSQVPADFFDKHESKRQKPDRTAEAAVDSADLDAKKEVFSSQSLPMNGTNDSTTVHVDGIKQARKTLPEGFFDEGVSENRSSNPPSRASKSVGSEANQASGTLPEGFFDIKEINRSKTSSQISQSSKASGSLEAHHFKGNLPEGFFDNKDADLRARGIQPIKVDINDAYKEFEKEIVDDLQEVDDRLEEEEIDAAEIRAEYESLEQKQYRERVEMVKKRLVEVKAAQLAKGQRQPAFMGQESSDETSSGSDDDEENFTVDWRAKHL